MMNRIRLNPGSVLEFVVSRWLVILIVSASFIAAITIWLYSLPDYPNDTKVMDEGIRGIRVCWTKTFEETEINGITEVHIPTDWNVVKDKNNNESIIIEMKEDSLYQRDDLNMKRIQQGEEPWLNDTLWLRISGIAKMESGDEIRFSRFLGRGNGTGVVDGRLMESDVQIYVPLNITVIKASGLTENRWSGSYIPIGRSASIDGWTYHKDAETSEHWIEIPWSEVGTCD